MHELACFPSSGAGSFSTVKLVEKRASSELFAAKIIDKTKTTVRMQICQTVERKLIRKWSSIKYQMYATHIDLLLFIRAKML